MNDKMLRLLGIEPPPPTKVKPGIANYTHIPIETVDDSWRNAPSTWGSKLHKIVPYCGSFPPALPHYFIRRYSKVGDTVLDPFSGRGTTALEACLLGRKGIGCDSSAVSYFLTKSKITRMSIVNVEKAIIGLEKKYEKEAKKYEPDLGLYRDRLLSVYDHGYGTRIILGTTLHQMAFIRDTLLSDMSREATFIKAMLMGICVGPRDFDLSVPVLGTICLHHNHFKRERIKKGAPRKNVFHCLMEFSKRYGSYMTSLPVEGEMYRGDATKLPLSDGLVDLTVTSPPYLNLINYYEKSWIRYWIAGVDKEEAYGVITTTGSKPKYFDFIHRNLSEIYRVSKDDTACVYVIGDYRDIEADVVECGTKAGFNCYDIYYDPIPSHLRAHRQMNDGGVADDEGGTNYNVVIVFEKGEPKVINNIDYRWDMKYHDVRQKTLGDW